MRNLMQAGFLIVVGAVMLAGSPSPQQRAACPARVPPRAAGLQAALAGAAGGVTPKGLLNFLSAQRRSLCI